MEGCGIKAGDEFLAGTLQSIFSSPAWTSQPSLLIVTFDEDGYDFQHPAQRVATLVVGSRFVKKGYVSSVRYTHYSLLRTIEAALGLGSLTGNDFWASPVNDVFTSPRKQGSGGAVTAESGASLTEAVLPVTKAASVGAPPASRAEPPGPVAYVANSASASVTPIDLVRRRAGPPIPVGRDPVAVAVAPDDSTAYVVDEGSNSVTPIDVATDRPGKAIRVGKAPAAIAITPNGVTAYVADSASNSVTPIDTATDRAEAPIEVGARPVAISIAPNGRTAYVVDQGAGAVTPITTATNRPGPPIGVGSYPSMIAITPDGATAFVTNYGSDTVSPIHLRTDRTAPAIAVGGAPDALAITANGATALVADGNSGTVTPIATASLRAGAPIPVGYSPTAIAVDPTTPLAFAVNTISGTITPIDTTTLKGRPSYLCRHLLVSDGGLLHRLRFARPRSRHLQRHSCRDRSHLPPCDGLAHRGRLPCCRCHRCGPGIAPHLGEAAVSGWLRATPARLLGADGLCGRLEIGSEQPHHDGVEVPARTTDSLPQTAFPPESRPARSKRWHAHCPTKCRPGRGGRSGGRRGGGRGCEPPPNRIPDPRGPSRRL